MIDDHNPGFTEPDDAPPIPDDDDSPVGSSAPDDIKPKRQVSYNEEAALCPDCKKRIRLNNDSRLRVHMSGKVGSSRCVGSDALVLSKAVLVHDIEPTHTTKNGTPLTEEYIQALADEAEAGYDPSKLLPRIFSDPE